MLGNISLRTRLIVSLLAVVVLVGTIYGVNVVQAQATSDEVDELQDSALPILLTLEEMEESSLKMTGEINSYGFLYREAQLAGDFEGETEDLAGERDEFFEAYEELVATIDRYEALTSGTQADTWIAEMRSRTNSIYLFSLSVFGSVRLGLNNSTPLEDLETVEIRQDQLSAVIDAALDVEEAKLTETNEAIDRRTATTTYVLAGLLVAALAVLATVALGVTNGIIRPVRQLEGAAIAIRTGNFGHRVNLHRQDELGALGGAFNDMAASIQRRDNELRELNHQLEGQLDETQKAREAAERSDEVKSAFLASMSHELRTPLNSIINFTKFVAKGMMGPVNEEQTNTLGEVIDSAKHLLSLINDVLDMSKIESGSLRLFVEENIDMKAVLDNVLSTGKSLIVDRPITIESQVAADLPTIRGDRQRLLQILLNIMSNACKFTEEGPIQLVACHENGEIKISVKDSGPGIAVEDQPLVFEAFKQTSAGLRQGGGTGLGMPISKNLAEAHGGKLWVESEFGKGATFIVSLPVAYANLTPVMK